MRFNLMIRWAQSSLRATGTNKQNQTHRQTWDTKVTPETMKGWKYGCKQASGRWTLPQHYIIIYFTVCTFLSCRQWIWWYYSTLLFLILLVHDRWSIWKLAQGFLKGLAKFYFSNKHLLASLLHCFVRGMLADIWVVAVTRLEMFWLLGEDSKRAVFSKCRSIAEVLKWRERAFYVTL